MRFVPVKSSEQQAILTLHRVGQGFVQERTATILRIQVKVENSGHFMQEEQPEFVARTLVEFFN
jgi:transposase